MGCAPKVEGVEINPYGLCPRQPQRDRRRRLTPGPLSIAER